MTSSFVLRSAVLVHASVVPPRLSAVTRLLAASLPSPERISLPVSAVTPPARVDWTGRVPAPALLSGPGAVIVVVPVRLPAQSGVPPPFAGGEPRGAD